MVLQLVTMYFNDSASQFNKDLTDFLKRNLETAIRKGSMSFDFKIVKTSDLAGLRNMGIRHLPAMVIGDTPYETVPKIIEEIRRRITTSKVSAIPKSEEEIVRDYQMNALGHITKDSDGKIKIEGGEEDDSGDSESSSLMDAFNAEISRRGKAIGHDSGGGYRPMTQTPKGAARNTEQDYDDDEPPPRRKAQGRPAPTQAQRQDNIDNPDMADAFTSLKNISKNATGEDAQDDAMMSALLARMGSD